MFLEKNYLVKIAHNIKYYKRCVSCRTQSSIVVIFKGSNPFTPGIKYFVVT
jgi:hypothetical protein